jgi:hypothetical protein
LAPHRVDPFTGQAALKSDIALLKSMSLSVSTSPQFRVETFNTFDHAQFPEF